MSTPAGASLRPTFGLTLGLILGSFLLGHAAVAEPAETLPDLTLAPSGAGLAQDGSVAVECSGPRSARDKVSFSLDFDRQAVSGAFPINWAWFARGSVLFGHSVQINGNYHTTQSYMFDRATRTLELCDFAGGGEQACERRQC